MIARINDCSFNVIPACYPTDIITITGYYTIKRIINIFQSSCRRSFIITNNTTNIVLTGNSCIIFCINNNIIILSGDTSRLVFSRNAALIYNVTHCTIDKISANDTAYQFVSFYSTFITGIVDCTVTPIHTSNTTYLLLIIEFSSIYPNHFTIVFRSIYYPAIIMTNDTAYIQSSCHCAIVFYFLHSAAFVITADAAYIRRFFC